MTERVDLVIAGAGPAGLAAAIQAAQGGLSVIVLDPREGVIDKACGEGIMPGGVELLEELGVRPAGAPFVGVQYRDAFDPNLLALGTFPDGVGLGVRRTALHAAMLRRAETCGVRLRRGRVGTFEQRADGVIVDGDLCARWLIGADGLRSHVRRALDVERPPRATARLGLRRHYAVRPWTDRVEVHFGDRAEAYVTPVDARLVGVALLFEPSPGREAAEAFDDLLAGFPLLAARLVNAPVASKLRGAGPFEQRVARRVVGDVLLVGDAAGYVDPLTGEGVALGLATARAAVASLLDGTPALYESRYRELTGRYFTLTSALLAVVRRPILRRRLLRIARSRPSLFDRALGLLAHLPAEPDSSPARPAALPPSFHGP